MRITEPTNENMLDQLHGELMSVVREHLDRAIEPIPTTLTRILDDALSQALATHGRGHANVPLLCAYVHELACEASRYDRRIHALSLGEELAAILETRLSQSAIAA